MRSQKLLENMKQIIRQRRRGRSLDDSLFQTPDTIKFGEAPHAQDEVPVVDVTLDSQRVTLEQDPEAPATSLEQDTLEAQAEQQAKRA